jgi:hypothetical protein
MPSSDTSGMTVGVLSPTEARDFTGGISGADPSGPSLEEIESPW